MRALLSDRRARGVAIVATSLTAAGLFALIHTLSAGATVRALAAAQSPWTLALLALAAAGPVLQSGLLRAGQATVGARFGRWEAIRLAAAINAANLAVHSAGAAGLAVLLADERAGDVGRLPRSAAYVLGRAVAHTAFAGLVLTALVLRGLDDHLSAIVVGGAALFFLSRVSHALLLWVAATRPRCLPRWRRLNGLRAHAPAFAVVLREAAGAPRRLVRIAAWALAIDLLRIGWLWVALHAAGARTSVDLTVETYGVVALLGTISILPAGLGTMDAGLVATLQHSGVAVAAAVAGVVLFRVAELWVPIAAGARPALAAARTALGRDAPSPARGRRGRDPQPGGVMGGSSAAATVPGMARERFTRADPAVPRLGAYGA